MFSHFQLFIIFLSNANISTNVLMSTQRRHFFDTHVLAATLLRVLYEQIDHSYITPYNITYITGD